MNQSTIQLDKKSNNQLNDSLDKDNKRDNENNSPQLHLIMGPMFAGKSTYLINKARDLINQEVALDQILIVNHSSDSRYDTNKICSHNGDKIDSYSVGLLDQLNTLLPINSLISKKYLLIDEAQFFPDLHETVIKTMQLFKQHDRSIIIYLFGLDGDYKQEQFNQSRILELIPYSSSVTKLLARCHICQSNAPFTKRIISSDAQILVGGSNEYQPVCFNHL